MISYHQPFWDLEFRFSCFQTSMVMCCLLIIRSISLRDVMAKSCRVSYPNHRTKSFVSLDQVNVTSTHLVHVPQHIQGMGLLTPVVKLMQGTVAKWSTRKLRNQHILTLYVERNDCKLLGFPSIKNEGLGAAFCENAYLTLSRQLVTTLLGRRGKHCTLHTSHEALLWDFAFAEA